MESDRRWVMDTSAFTHLCRAGHAELIERLAPHGVILVPTEVNTEIERGRERYNGIPAIDSLAWAELVVLDDDETILAAQVKVQMGGGPGDHLGECAVIAYAQRHELIAILDERAAIAQADRLNVDTRDTLWIVIQAHKELFGRDRSRTADVFDDLVATDMKLPNISGQSFVAWAYENGLLP